MSELAHVRTRRDRLQSGALRLVGSRLGAYALVTATAALSTLLTVPVIVRLVGLDGYGDWTLLEPLVFFGATLAFFGAEHGAMKRIAYDGDAPEHVAGSLVATGLPLAGLSGLLVFVLATRFAPTVDAALVGAVTVAEGLLAILMTSARAARWTGTFSVAVIGRTFAVLVAFVGLLASAPAGSVTSTQLWSLRLAVVLGCVAVVLACMAPRLALRVGAFLEACRYGAAILATSLLVMVLEHVDRYAIEHVFGGAAVGAYVVHVKIAALIGQGVVTPFALWFPAERLRHVRDADGGDAFFDRTARALLAVGLGVGGVVLVAGPLLFEMLAPGTDRGAFDRIALAALVLASVATGLSYALNVGLLKPGHTRFNLVGALVACAIGVPATIALAALAGPAGAAVGRLSGIVALAVCLYALSQRIHPIRFRIGAMAVQAGAAAVALSVVLAVLPRAAGGWLLAAGALAYLAVFCALLALLDRDLLRTASRAAERLSTVPKSADAPRGPGGAT